MSKKKPSFSNRTREESLDIWKKLPLFAITKCNEYNHIPIIQWTLNRDGIFEEWDERMKLFSQECDKIPWESRKQYFLHFHFHFNFYLHFNFL